MTTAYCVALGECLQYIKFGERVKYGEVNCALVLHFGAQNWRPVADLCG